MASTVPQQAPRSAYREMLTAIERVVNQYYPQTQDLDQNDLVEAWTHQNQA
jgi:hypothetical protein